MPLNVRLPDELVERIDAQRGAVPRERFVRDLLGEALGGESRASTDAPAAPRRAHGSPSPSLKRFGG